MRYAADSTKIDAAFASLVPNGDAVLVTADPLFAERSAQIVTLPDRQSVASRRFPSHFRPKHLRGLEVDHKFKFGGPLNGQIGGFFAIEDAADIDTDFANLIGMARAVADQAADNSLLAHEIARRHRVLRC